MSFYQHPTAIIDEGAIVGKGSRIWHFTHIMAGASIGLNCNIGQNLFIAEGVKLGNNVKVQNNVSLYEGVFCEDDVFIGPSVVFTNITNPRSSIIRKNQFKNTIIKKGASIGANATILCGIEIGAYAMVGAGTVLTKSLLPYSLVIGNPGKQIGWVSEHGNTLKFNAENFATCSESQNQYQLNQNGVRKI